MMRRLAILGLALALLAGCATAPAVRTGQAEAQRARVEALQAWSVDGKLAVRTATDAQTAQFAWRQDGEAFDIRLSGPAGLKATRIYGMPGGVVFEQGSRRERAGSAEGLSRRLVGWPLPVDGLVYWMRGLPDPGAAIEQAEYGADGLLAGLAQSGWEVRFAGYQPVDGLQLPARLEARHGDVRVTLVVKRWVLP